MNYFYHQPVMFKETIDSLACKPGKVYVDGTLGGGGHSYEILRRTTPDGIVVGIDCDGDAIRESRKKLELFSNRTYLVKGNFADIKTILAGLHIEMVDGILLDLGVSSHQLNTAERGFSFSLDAPLDMRMDRDNPFSAYELVNKFQKDELITILRKYGEEIYASRIVRTILKKRELSPIKSTRELAEIIAGVVPRQNRKNKIHPATRTFQALRIAVNDELSNLHKSINDGIDLLKTEGIFSIISFHSLEDRIVKKLFRSWERGCICPPNFPVCTCNRPKKLRVITRKPITPQEEEVQLNPRSRSAKLRTAIRV